MPRPPLVQTEEILRVARTHFITGGHTASVHSIARDLGVSHSALLQRFGSKRQLFLQSMQPPLDFPWPDVFLSGPPERFELAIYHLRESCEMICTFFREHSPCMGVLRAAGVEPNEIFHEGLPLPLRACEVITSWVKRGQNQGVFGQCDAAAFASTLVGAMHARAFLSTLVDHDREQTYLGEFDGVIELFSKAIYPAAVTSATTATQFQGS